MNGLLVVDDEEGVRRAVQKALGKESYEIFLAPNGSEAIAIVKEHSAEITICISDFKMPGLDGLQTLAAIGNINPDITRIMLTGYATLEGAIAATNEGIDGFLTKPFDNVELRAKVRECFVRKRLKQFVSMQVLQELQTNPGHLTPRKQAATLLFIDIRGFTALTEKHDPQEWALFLSDNYFGPLGEIVFQNNGTLDKHIGDGIMAIYGAPIAAHDDALRAVRSAVEMRAKMQEINAHYEPDFRLPIAIGVHSGEVVVGMFGSARKREYTALGHTVNVAARLEQMAASNQILISSQTYELVRPRVEVARLEPIMVKGLTEPLQVYNVLCMT
ncbi:adenylate cyclase [Thermoflexales bacterium]|nr:adenylate cyclase [Thermoflexales bacterium]